MASYAELRTASENEVLLIKVQVACVIAANAISAETTGTLLAERMAWAKSVYIDPHGTARRMVWAVLAKNAGATLTAIANASDAAVQTNVNDSVNVFATVSAAV